MILIYTHNTSPRLQYICQFIFSELLGVTHSITLDPENFDTHEGPKISYSDRLFHKAYPLLNRELLFEKDIRIQPIDCFDTNGYKAFFKTENSGFPFDILAASFYLLSRYEEYLPHEQDMYGRYAHKNSLAFKERFLNKPLINIWLSDFRKSLELFFPGFEIPMTSFRFLPTYDIDIAYSFKHKGLIRNLGGFLRSPSLERMAVLSGLRKDPFDSYAYMQQLHQHYGLDPIYFFLVATSGSNYDKNISPYSSAMWQLIRQHAKKFRIGLHPSWRSNRNLSILKREKKILETAANIPIHSSRQHYIKFSLPETYESLIQAGIEHDYSMGYGSINGFRASVAAPFFWYDLKTDKATSLTLHPFCYMDANSFYEQNMQADKAYDELLYYQDVCKNINGTFISIFHNNFLGTDKQFSGWKEMYTRFIAQVPQ